MNSVGDADGIVVHGLAHAEERRHEHGPLHVGPAGRVEAAGGHHHAEAWAEVGLGRRGAGVSGAAVLLPGRGGGAPTAA